MLARIAFEDPQTVGNPRELDVADYEQHLPRRLRARRLSGASAPAPARRALAAPPRLARGEAPHPVRERRHLRRHDLARLRVDEPRLVERLARGPDHHLGLEQRVRLERVEAWCAGRAASSRSPAGRWRRP